MSDDRYTIRHVSLRPYDRLDVVFKGTLAGTEIWTCGLTVADPVAGAGLNPSLANLQSMANAAQTRMATAFGSFNPVIGSVNQSIDNTTVYFRLASVAAAKAVAVSTAAPTAGTGTAVKPPQVALCLTLKTGFAGRANRGRMYLPATGGALVPTGGNLTTVCTAIATLIGGISSDFSSTLGTAVGPVVGDAHHLIVSVKTDNVYDTQRRRRNKIVPTAFADVAVIVP